MHYSRRHAGWSAGALSGALGGLVGNQSGIRSAAMLGFDVPKASFVATATAIAWTRRDCRSIWLSERTFRRLVAVVLLAPGTYMLLHAAR